MNVLCDRRDERVVENKLLRLGEITFRPRQKPAEGRAEMSADTWALIENDESLARTYTIARARAMRQHSSSAMNLIGVADRSSADALASLEQEVAALLGALHAIRDPSDFASGDLIRRRQKVRKDLILVRSRVEAVSSRFEVIEELLESKVLT